MFIYFNSALGKTQVLWSSGFQPGLIFALNNKGGVITSYTSLQRQQQPPELKMVVGMVE
jgi:hypothetical protein